MQETNIIVVAYWKQLKFSTVGDFMVHLLQEPLCSIKITRKTIILRKSECNHLKLQEKYQESTKMPTVFAQ